MTRKKKLFIASSREAKPLAEALDQYVREQNDPVEIVAWYDPKTFPPSSDTLATLLSHCEKCDFAVALLTADDLTTQRSVEHRAPRDNVIFELGLFIGGLGLDPGRCFMISGVERDALPSDLRGKNYIKIKQPEDLEDRDECYEAVKGAGYRILAAVRESSCYERPKLAFLASSTLADMERSKDEGGNLSIEPDEIAVVVNSVAPVETRDLNFARNVLENLKAGAKYEYFWGKFDDNKAKAVNIVRSIAIADLTDKIPGDPIPLMRNNLQQVRQNLTSMQKRLSIHFRKRPPLQFCVHNAQSEDHATCYLRHPGGFVRWSEGRDAKEVANELHDSCKTKDEERSIFHSTVDFTLSKDGGAVDKDPLVEYRREALMSLMRDRFPADLHSTLEVICFGP